MQYEYFYGAQAEQFSFYRIPKALFTEPNFRELSTDAKVLYGILLDRMSLSLKNQWLDAQNKVYIIFTVDEIMDAGKAKRSCCGYQELTNLQNIQACLDAVCRVAHESEIGFLQWS